MENKLCKGCPDAKPITDKSVNPKIIGYFCTMMKRKVTTPPKACPMLEDDYYGE